MSDGIKVDFAEIDRMSTAIKNLNSFAAPLIPKIGALSVDGDLLASAILSPGTAAAAEGAVLNASAQLGLTVVSTEALVLITASLSKVYLAAEAGLAASAATLKFGATITEWTLGEATTVVGLAVKTATYGSIAIVALAHEAIASGLVTDVARVALKSIAEAWLTAVQSEGTLPEQLAVFASATAANFDKNFAAALPGLSPKIAGVEQSALGDLRRFGSYDNLLATLIADGNRFGLFEDGTPRFVDDAISEHQLDRRRETAFGDSVAQTGLELRADAHGNVVPTDVASLFASSSQIDLMGQQDFGNIRIIRVVGEDGVVRYTVQVPSTQSWDPDAGAIPNDLTSDVHAMRYGTDTALSTAVFEAMKKAGITDEPVMMTGFSLGGITAGAIAADPHGYNVQQVVTAGSPIGAMDIPTSTRVTAFESTSDPIAPLDGTANPDQWTTVSGMAPSKLGETDPPTVANAHDANRYAVMASQDPAVNNDAAIGQFLGGRGKTTTVTDYQVQRQ
ncbi:hypothetical protein JOE58_000310 [Curtobacterium luteum]|uniref:Fungal lipase-like domain-containing protein n=1 Tax=Curtobacterium luteum TaxID=33881 RepID=A0A8H9G9T0_9MICO|nr:hypothetical protein [Curtobacterium luteum]MBM7801059.1 hypothetical protein [Curtobacterium luteum]NUU50608.1 hypothetical protein [Curtobacterium luteum]GGL05746.1 hypothetical protein GCM10009769_24970 [Curtobacterium luteum]